MSSETVGAGWLIARRTLAHWTRAKLAKFNDEHLGDGGWDQASDDALRLVRPAGSDGFGGERGGQAASSVIEAHIELSSKAEADKKHKELVDKLIMSRHPTHPPAPVVPAPLPTVPAVLPAAGAPAEPSGESPPAQQAASTHSAPPPTTGKRPKVVRAPVIFSYQSGQVDFLKQLRKWLNDHGIATVDGTQVPAGMDWRIFYFSALKKAHILLPVLSESFMFSRACESELTYGIDKGKSVIPILCDPKYMAVLSEPENYVHIDEDIELRAPKIDMFLSTRNRYPANGKFEDNFEENAQALLVRIKLELQSAKADDSRSEAHGEGKLPWQLAAGATDIDKMVACLKSNSDSATALGTLKALQLRLFELDKPDEKGCETAILAQPAEILSQLVGSEREEIQVIASDCIKTLAMVGSWFGPGLHEFRQAATDANVVPRLLAMMVPEFSKDAKHVAMMALNYVTRVKSAKLLVAKSSGIQKLIAMVDDPDNTSHCKAVALAILWNEVYEPEHKDIMIESGIIDTIVRYIHNPKSIEEGQKSCYFIMSHLSYKYPEQVNDSGIVEFALEVIGQTSSPLPTTSLQTLEGACRLMDTIAGNSQTRHTLPAKGAMPILLHALDLSTNQSGGFSGFSKASMTVDAKSSMTNQPKDAFKMRAANALNHMAKALPEAEQAVSDYLERLIRDHRIDASALVWLCVQPTIRGLILRRSSLIEMFRSQVKDRITYDLAILLIAMTKSAESLDELIYTQINVPADRLHPAGPATIGDFVLSVFSCSGQVLCVRWAILCQSVRIVQEALLSTTGQSRIETKFCRKFVTCLIEWLQGGHPYKFDGLNTIKVLIRNRQLLALAAELLQRQPHKLSAATQEALKSGATAEIVATACEELSRQ